MLKETANEREPDRRASIRRRLSLPVEVPAQSGPEGTALAGSFFGSRELLQSLKNDEGIVLRQPLDLIVAGDLDDPGMDWAVLQRASAFSRRFPFEGSGKEDFRRFFAKDRRGQAVRGVAQ